MLFNSIEELFGPCGDCSKDFFIIYEDENGDKWIGFSGYIYTEGEPGTDENGEEDENLCYRVVEYSGGMDFALEEYVNMSQTELDYAYDIRGNDYIGDISEEEALAIANNWFTGREVKKISEVTIDTPCGYYIWE